MVVKNLNGQFSNFGNPTFHIASQTAIANKDSCKVHQDILEVQGTKHLLAQLF
jgi:hypothetical protein